MDHIVPVIETAHQLYVRNETAAGNAEAAQRPPVYKVIGIALAVGSGAFIGTSFVLKKVGLLKANEKYNEVAGEGYGYLKNWWWWSGMTLMIIGEICNFVAYAFTDAILVTPLGALSVVITTILSAIFLKERLSMVGKVACFLCIVGSVVIVMNAPAESSVANIQQMQKFVITPGFLSYTGVIIVGAIIAAFYCGPRWGKKNMLVYISICSWIGGLSVVATQGLGAAVIAQIGGTPQFNQWFLYVLLVFVIATLLTEIVYLNKALNLFNAALVTPTYYVYFTSTTIITSSVLFQGFKGTPTSIVTVINGFFTICAGVVLLQLSKSAKDVPDAAVFKGDLDQIQTIAEQEQPETEPKADAIRGTAAIVRRLSSARQKMEIEELRRLHEEKEKERLEPVSEDGAPEYEWDGLRRRRTMIGSQRQRANTTPNPFHGSPATPGQPTPHPPLGWSHFPTEEELAERDRPTSPGILQSIAGTIRGRARSTVLPGHPEFSQNNKVQSPMHPVQLTEISVNPGQSREHDYGLPSSLAAQKTEYEGAGGMMSGSSDRHVRIVESRVEPQQSSNYNPVDGGSTLAAPTNQGGARRQFSFQNVFRRAQQDADGAAGSGGLAQTGRPRVLSRGYSGPQLKGATEEERLGLVKGDSHSGTAFPSYDEDEPAGDTDLYADIEARRAEKYGRGITSPATSRRGSDDEKSRSSPPRSSPPRSSPPRSRAPTGVVDADIAEYDASRRRFHERGASGGSSSRATPAPPPRPLQKDRPAPRGGGDGAAFI